MDELVQALHSTGYQFAHFGWSRAPKGDYGVYAEEGANDLIASGCHAERAVRLTVDYFTRAVDSEASYNTRSPGLYETVGDGVYSRFDAHPAKTAIEAAFDRCGCAWYLNSVQFEDDTGYVHFEWVVECPG